MNCALEPDPLIFALIARLRGHGHLCNVLTHVGLGNWRAIEQAIVSILRPRARANEMNAIARNIVELLIDSRGVTGPIMRSVFFDAVAGEAGTERSRQLKRKIARLRERMKREAHRQAERARAGHAAVIRHDEREKANESVPLSKAA
jgi:hypothetical protein